MNNHHAPVKSTELKKNVNCIMHDIAFHYEKNNNNYRVTCLDTSFESSASILRSSLGFTAASFMDRNYTTNKKKVR
jgi:hypothetical protein